MKTSRFRTLAVAFCLLVAGGAAAISIRYPVLWSAIEWLLIGIVLAVAATWWWASRKHRIPERLRVGTLTQKARRGLRRDLLVALGIGFASVVGLLTAINVADYLFGRQIPGWLVMLCAVAWVGAALVVAAPFIKRASRVVASQIALTGEGDESRQDEA